jgi:hypothetical protein
MTHWVEKLPPEDRDLLTLVAAEGNLSTLAECSPLSIQALAEVKGLDFTTALLFDRVLRIQKNRSFFGKVNTNVSFNLTGSLLIGIVPGAFYLDHKNTGADGAAISKILDSISCRAEVIPVESFGALSKNAAIISNWLFEHRGQKLALVSLSKGGADVKAALADPGAAEAFRDVESWVSISGLVQGTPLVAWLRSQLFRRWGVRLLLWLRGQRYSVVEELRHEPDGPLATWPAIPLHLQMVHVVSFPLRKHLAHPWAGRAYQRLARLGPNDGGGVLLADVGKLPGIILPVWGADHYLQPAWDVASLVRRIFAEAFSFSVDERQTNQSTTHPSNPPASKSIA